MNLKNSGDSTGFDARIISSFDFKHRTAYNILSYHTLLLSVFSLCNAVGFIFIKVLGFARDPSISDFAWCFAVI